MRRVVLTVVATVAGLVAMLQFKTAPAGSTSNRFAALAPVTATSSPDPSSPAPASPSRSSRVKHATRTAVGAVVETKYGPVQVRVTESGAGRVTAATTTRTPYRDRRSVEIAARATPILDREAVAAGSARIHTVSGATYTSDGYAQSLQSALDRIHA